MLDNRLEGVEPQSDQPTPPQTPPQTPTQAETPAESGGEPNAIRTAFLARTMVGHVSASAVVVTTETVVEGLAVRSAYLARIAATRTETAGVANPSGGDILRRAYAARLASADAAAAPSGGKQVAARSSRKPAQAKPRSRAAIGLGVKAKQPSRAAKARQAAGGRGAKGASRPRAQKGKRKRG